MGCDIHGWVETRTDGKWVAVCELEDRRRNYPRFAALAGVRAYPGTSNAKPLGVPADVSETAKYHIERHGTDGHSHSYISIREAVYIFQATAREKSICPEYDHFGVELWEDGESIDDYRLVFWFDN